MKQRTQKRCFMIIALSLAALFLVNNASLVYAYEDQLVVPEFKAVATITDDQGNTHELDVIIDHSTAKETNRSRSLTGDIITTGEIEATVVIPTSIIPRADVTEELTRPDEWDASVTAKVTIVYTTRSYSNGVTGVLLTYVRNNCTNFETGVSLEKVETYYYCNGTTADGTALLVNNQRGTKVGWSASHSLSTGFSTFIMKNGPEESMGATSDFYLKMGNTRRWVTTVSVIY